MGEDRPLQLLESRAWLETELIRKRATCVSVDRKCLRLATGAIQGEHQLAAQPLAQRLPRNELLELLDDRIMSADR